MYIGFTFDSLFIIHVNMQSVQIEKKGKAIKQKNPTEWISEVI